jgi:hypothetical protein
MKSTYRIITLLLIFTLTSCDGTKQPLTAPMPERCECGATLLTDAIHSTPPLYMLPIGPFTDKQFVDNVIGSFRSVHELTDIRWEADWNHTILIWTDTALRNFSYNALAFDFDGGIPHIHEHEPLITVGELAPGDVFVLKTAPAHYLTPIGALIFTDENGSRTRLYITENLDETEPTCVCFWRFQLVPY